MDLRAIDRLIAEKVMGWSESICFQKLDGVGPYYWSPTTQIADAWQVVEKLEEFLAVNGCPEVETGKRREKGHFRLEGPYLHRPWRAGWMERDDEWYLVHADGETAPLAICLAALKSVGVDVK